MRIQYHPRALKEELRLDPPVRRRIRQALQLLAAGDRSNVRTLKSHPSGSYHLKVAKDWRVIFVVYEKDTILVTRIGHRSSIYR